MGPPRDIPVRYSFPFIGYAVIVLAIVLSCCNAELTPPYFNLATGRKIYATATCGVDTDGPELYCKLVGANTENDNHFSVIQGQVCDTCDPSRPDKNHPPENAIDGMDTWWQSPPLSRGMKYNEVNLTIDFEQEFHVAYVFIRMGNSPRPGLWTLEKSSDYGKTWSAWQHFSDTPSDCETYFGKDSLRPIMRDDDVICTTEYSKIVPLENGEIPVMLVNNRPSSNNYFNSPTLQEWTRATNIRIRLYRTKNLLGHLMSVARQDPTVTRRYFYSIKDISIGGRCMCNGHADTCDVADIKSKTRLLACICQHNTCGIQCNECCPGFEQKKWQQNTNAKPFHCEPCNCFGHSNRCVYDEEVDRKGLSLDIHGDYDGGGVCQFCQHNTEGINCNKCKPKYYRPYGKYWNETDVCKPCGCNYHYSTGNCAEETGICECRIEYQPPNCDKCAYGYFGYPYCRECECFLNGTQGYHCEAQAGTCPCKQNFGGPHCKQCANGFFQFPECKDCGCNRDGSLEFDCDLETGQCQCDSRFGGDKCDRCKHGYFSFPECTYCDCDIRGTQEEICNKTTSQCLCREGYGGPRCDQCIPGYYNYPDCVPCNCSTIGSSSVTCDVTGKCKCLSNFVGKQCTSCSAGYYKYPECLPCVCEQFGSEGISCNTEGQCQCLPHFDGPKCDRCKEGYYNYPACEDCNCDPAGVIPRFAGCGSVPAGELCQCKDRVTGRICDQCRPLFWNLNVSNPDGCEVCDCFLDGTVGSLDTCDSKTGQCTCKPSVGGRQCKMCKDGTFDLFGGNLFGCKDCGCDVGGSRNAVCDKISGQCNCHFRVSGRKCSQPLTTHYFPTLYQFQYEYEDGYTPSGAYVRYQYDENLFPGFSRKGYAVFSNVQNEVINEVNVFKSSVYRMVIRYVNPSNENITAKILVTSDNPNDVDQNTVVLFKPTAVPQFVTVSGSKGEIPSPIVLDPGRYTIHIKTDKNVLLDYFVLLPGAYYEASILTRNIENPCEMGNTNLCKHYVYPSVAEFKPSLEPFIIEGDQALNPLELYEDPEHLSMINEHNSIPLVTDRQQSLKYLVDIPQSGKYIVVIDYITDRNTPDTYYVKVRANDDEEDYGIATLYPCLYTTVCRQPVIDDDSREKVFTIDVVELKPIEVYHEHEDFGRVAIKSVTAVPVDQWSVDYIKPNEVCVMQDHRCTTTDFRTAPDSKKVEFEHGHEHIIAEHPPFTIADNSTKLIYIDRYHPSIEIRSKVSTPGRYVIIIKYYQPNHPQFTTKFQLQADKQKYDGKFKVDHCPSNTGCRQILRTDGVWWFDIDSDFNFTLTNNEPHGVWLDYVFLVPIEHYHDNLLVPEMFDQTKEFIQKCGQDHFHIQLNATEFCKKAVFSLTADYNNGVLPCNCDYEGSTSFECDPFGGQCQCKPNVIGRQCEACRTGFYGFPDCKHCDCPLTALCHKDTGECICPPHVRGEKCDQCEPYTYGFHQIIGCEECNCNPLGVERGNLQCDLHNGTCKCRPNIKGRACDECFHGFHNFPRCEQCRCNLPGTTFEVCDKTDETCFCKKNVVGRGCERCSDGTYNLQASNPEGCTKCFCFGKTTRCESAFLMTFNVSLLRNISINTIAFDGEIADLTQWNIPSEEIFLNETTLQVDYSFKDTDEGLTYFGVLDYLLNQNNHLTAYGGHLVYTLYYTTGPFGNAVFGPDVILQGRDSLIVHQSYEQPANEHRFQGSVRMVETNFLTLDKKPVSRSEFMMILRDLTAIYIRASYWEPTVVTQLSDVYLQMADEDDNNYQSYKELSVEKCHCPPGYTGLSCEDCAPGYYRDPDGPFGGYCIPCQCNGHADTCDCNTGICQECRHFTTGDHCEFCIEGYHGNATYGTPHDCMICACPLPYDSNNFATTCEISETGREIHCHCKPGYTGARCESCAQGYFGQPEKLNDYCKPCECSGNINLEAPGSCDTVTGECLLCLNNTFGRACNLCAPGYYGDAVKLKDCKSCDCEDLGTFQCDSFVGTCNCHENVIGERCDRCEPDHYGYDSGLGCKPCDCALASNQTQCDDHTGLCQCKPGVTGRQCDRCAVDHWNYTSNGCVPCQCNKGYSRGFGCNARNGQCECLPGVVGEKCDACPYRWVLIKDQGCSECDGCHHALLNVTDAMRHDLDPIVKDFESVALAFFTSQKLAYYNNLTDEIEPKVLALDPRGVNLTPIDNEIGTLEGDAKNMGKKISYTEQSAKECADDWSKLLVSSGDVLDQSRLANTNARNTIKEVENLAKSFSTAAVNKAENAVAEAQDILDEIVATEYDTAPAVEQLEKSIALLGGVEIFNLPVALQNESLYELRGSTDIFNNKLDDLQEWSAIANSNSEKVELHNRKNKELFENSQFDTVGNQTRETNKNMNDTMKAIAKAEVFLLIIQKNLASLDNTLDELKQATKHVDKILPEAYDEYHAVSSVVSDASYSARKLEDVSNKLAGKYSNITSNSEDAIRAATAYSDIVKAVEDAQKAVKNSNYAAGNATELGDGVRERASKSDQAATEVLVQAMEALNTVQADLGPHLNKSGETVEAINNLNERSKKKLQDINLALDKIPKESRRHIWVEAYDKAVEADRDAKAALEILKPIVSQIPKDLEMSKNMPKDVDTTNKDIIQTKNQVDRVQEIVPKLRELVDKLAAKQEATNHVFSDIGARVEHLKQQIEMARRVANSIKVGVRFHPNTVLELKTPESVERQGTTTEVSAYFRTDRPNGFLMYLGNENKPEQRQEKEDDYMAIQIENGYPVLTFNVGNGAERIINKKYVADNQWYQVVVDRTGNNVKFTIREELPDGVVRTHETEETIPGPYSVFNVDKDSRLFVGGYPPDFNVPEDVKYSSFEGDIENMKIGDQEAGLWNFVDGQDNMQGAQERDRLIERETPITGYRFNGNGYVVLDARPYSFKLRSSIHFQFKASKDSKDGLLFYAGKDRHFISVELRDGDVVFQYKLGEHLVSIAAGREFNDDNWHRVEAERDGRKGLLKIDGKAIMQKETPVGTEENLQISSDMHIGGIPWKSNHSEVVNKNFDGCINEVQISGTPVDLSRHLQALGIRPGCPDKFSSSLSFAAGQFGYLKKPNVTSDNNFDISLKFRSKQRDGIIFFAANYDQSSTIGLALHEGSLVLTSMLQSVSTANDKFNNGDWHVVTVSHNQNQLRFSVNDTKVYKADRHAPKLNITSGEIFFGGVPHSYSPATGSLPTLAYFLGCINDVTLNGKIVNFANATDKSSTNTDHCPNNIFNYDPAMVPLYYPGQEHKPLEPHHIDHVDRPHVHVDGETVPPWHVHPTEPTHHHPPPQTEPPHIRTEAPSVHHTHIPDTVTARTPPSRPVVTPAPTKKPTSKPRTTECKLPPDPEFDVDFEAGYRFGTAANSRAEYTQLNGKIKKNYDFSLEFKTKDQDGILFYASDARHTDFIALYLQSGRVNYIFKSAASVANISSRFEYDDDHWHHVVFNRQATRGRLIIDGQDNQVGELSAGTRLLAIPGPVFIGGVDAQMTEDVSLNLLIDKRAYYDGCIRNLEMGSRLLTPSRSVGVIPCSQQVEDGIFFGKNGGYVKLRERFRVGSELTISFDIKPRSNKGLLMSVHGRKAYLILQLLDGVINFTVDNGDGDGPIVAEYAPAEGESFCDGEWRTVQAIKSQYVITLSVNSTASQPAIGSASSPSTDTSRPLFLGGHPYLHRVKGIKARQPYLGCIRNLKIRETPEVVHPDMVTGDVQTGVCSTN